MILNSAEASTHHGTAVRLAPGDPSPATPAHSPPDRDDRASAERSLDTAGSDFGDAAQQAALERQVNAEQVRMFYQQLPVATALSVLAAVVLTAILWTVVNQSALIAWATVMLALQGFRAWFFLPFRVRGIADENYASWGRYLVIATTFSGLMWGAVSVMFFSASSDEYQTSMIAMIFAVAAVGGPLTASYLPSLFGFVVPTLLPIIASSFLVGDWPHLVLSAIGFCVLVGILAVGLKYNRVLAESLRNRFRIQELAGRLQVQNAELQRAREVAESASRAKSQFFAAASHDLRQPLHAMGLFAASLTEKVHDPEALAAAGNIAASVGSLEALFNELLDVSKIDAGGVVPHAHDFTLQAMLDRLAADFAQEAAEKRLQFRLRPCAVRVHSDPLLLERILRNLVSNAICHTEKGGVLIGCRHRRSHLRIEIWDTGVGIANDQQARIFDEFVQLANPERDQRKGLGLGLSIVRRLAYLLGHPIDCDSRVGRGSVFRIDVPLATNAQTDFPVAGAAATAGRGLAGKRIAVVDDQQAILNGMSALLTAWGADVIAGRSTADVLEALRGQVPDLILADYQMQSGKLGTEAIAEIRMRCCKEVAAIIITGDTSPEGISAARASGFHWLIKPVRPAKLRALINFELNPPPCEA